MYGIYHDTVIEASATKVFEAITTSQGLEMWWTKKSEGNPGLGEVMTLFFSKEYDWEAKCVGFEKDKLVQWKMTRSMADWMKTKLTFEVIYKDKDKSLLRFTHDGWEEVDEHFRRCSYSWALYFRKLKRYLEIGEVTPYEQRTKC